jgi:hypothetical protein
MSSDGSYQDDLTLEAELKFRMLLQPFKQTDQIVRKIIILLVAGAAMANGCVGGQRITYVSSAVISNNEIILHIESGIGTPYAAYVVRHDSGPKLGNRHAHTVISAAKVLDDNKFSIESSAWELIEGATRQGGSMFDVSPLTKLVWKESLVPNQQKAVEYVSIGSISAASKQGLQAGDLAVVVFIGHPQDEIYTVQVVQVK